jgi:hypothetical protein
VTIELEVLLESRLQPPPTLIVLERYIPALNGTPKPLDQDISQGATSAVQTDFYISAGQLFSTIRECKLAALIDIEDF